MKRINKIKIGNEYLIKLLKENNKPEISLNDELLIDMEKITNDIMYLLKTIEKVIEVKYKLEYDDYYVGIDALNDLDYIFKEE